jgi:formate dehydrogenase major subunit
MGAERRSGGTLLRVKRRHLPRLTQPLVRDASKPRGVNALRPATWDEALDRAASGIRASVDRHGPSTFGVFSCSKATNEVNYMAMKVARATVGSNNIDSCNRT